MLSNASLSNTRSYIDAPAQTFTTTLSYKGWLRKRLFDIVFSLVISFCILLWLIPLLGLAIKLNSPGPILFVQLRTGRNGRQFRCFKLRTMIMRQDVVFQQATKDDPRVTKLGKLLRKTNMDELPQFLNVLMGHMSLVGPRPHPLPLDAQHWNTMPKYTERYSIKPGITGLAQVRGCRGETDTLMKMAHRVRLDRWYIANRSFGLDLKICWWTITRMLQGDDKAH